MKKQFRKKVLELLKTLSVEEKIDQSRIITQKVLQHDKYKTSKRICIYLSLPSEVDTNEILENVFLENRKCFIPQYYEGTNRMEMLQLYSKEDYLKLPLTKWKIRQPSFSDETRENCLHSDDGLDLMLLPGLAFTKNGYRCGKGGGYYDTFLKRCMEHPKGKPYCIGLAFREQMFDEIPFTEGQDVPVDEVIHG